MTYRYEYSYTAGVPTLMRFCQQAARYIFVCLCNVCICYRQNVL